MFSVIIFRALIFLLFLVCMLNFLLIISFYLLHCGLCFCFFFNH